MLFFTIIFPFMQKIIFAKKAECRFKYIKPESALLIRRYALMSTKVEEINAFNYIFLESQSIRNVPLEDEILFTIRFY